MAGKITLWGAGEILRTFFSRTGEPPPNFYLALIKDIPPTPYLSGTELDEPDFEEYNRFEIPNDDIAWTNEGQIQIMVCETDIAFTEAVETWGTIRYWALCNAPVDGFVYFIGDFERPSLIDVGDTVVVNPGDLSVSLGPFFFKED
jgi:hypothetical protein